MEVEEKDVKASALSETVSSLTPALETRASNGDLSGALEELATLEKQTRNVRLIPC
jgi:hypothetical protein